MSFRKKIIFTQVFFFVLFFAALFPLIEKMSVRLVKESLIESTTELKDLLEEAQNEEELISLLQEQEYYNFFRMGIVNDKGIVIFDTHMSKLKKDQFVPYVPTAHGEIADAFKKGVGYVVAYSTNFGTRFAYVAERFNFQGKSYILRTAFPFGQIQELAQNFEIGMLIFSFVALLIFNAIIWLIFNRFTRPIRQITDQISPYQKGEIRQLPEIILPLSKGPADEFDALAGAFNRLSAKIQEQIDDLTIERNEKGAILESLGEGVIATDQDSSVLYVNQTAAKMLGVKQQDLTGKPFEVEGKLGKRCKELMVRAAKEEQVTTDAVSLGKERRKYFDLIATAKAKGSGVIVVLQDKTNHYRILEMGKDFVANASHELRTPITIIRGYSETLHDMPELPREKVEEITQKLQNNCERMESLIKNLLMLADIENLPEEEYGKLDLLEVLESSSRLSRAVHPDAQITITSKDDLSIQGDLGLLELGFSNLLNNAAKYSKGPAQIDVVIEKKEDRACVRIADKGMGIPKADLPHIFDRFYRVDKTHSRRLGGAGLGLSIVKTIVLKHEGKIKVHSIVDEGSTFILDFPIV